MSETAGISETVQCSRCGEHKPRQKAAPYAGADGQLIQETVCSECWADWREEEVRTINELKLNFMDPAAQATLRSRMFSFLGLAVATNEQPNEDC